VTLTSFPEGFIWGTATAAHQVEGGNWNNDWWAWEHAPDTPCLEPSGDACDHRWRYPADLDLLRVSDSVPDTCRFLLEAYQNETWKTPGQGEGPPGPVDYP